MLIRIVAVAAVVLAGLGQVCQGADTNASPVAVAGTNRVEEANVQEMLRAYLHLQEQLHATQLAVEETRKESDEMAAQNAKALAARLQAIEQSLATQRARELDAMQSSNRVMLIVAGTFAGLGFLAMLLMAYFQWRTVSRLAEITASLPPPAARALPAPVPLPALGPGDGPLVSASPVESINSRLVNALDRLEKRILDLESEPGSKPTEQHIENGDAQPNGETSDSDPQGVTPLLGKGQSLLNLDKVEEALGCFEQVLKKSPDHAEALVKKGAALERLRRSAEAIECYDRAIAIDRNLTIAYLYKGGLFNRLERYGEALECYEQALKTQDNRKS